MKRRTVKTILCAALLTLAMTATACGGSDSAKESEAPAVEEEAPAEEEKPAEEEAPAEEEKPAEEKEEAASEGKTLEDLVKEDPTIEQQLLEQSVQGSNDQMEMSVEIKGNDLLVIATYKEGIELPDNTAENLEAALDTMESAFKGLAGVLDEAVGAEKGTVSYSVKYCDSDGNVLAERSYKAE